MTVPGVELRPLALLLLLGTATASYQRSPFLMTPAHSYEVQTRLLRSRVLRAVAPVEEEPLNEVDLRALVGKLKRDDERRLERDASDLLLREPSQLDGGEAEAAKMRRALVEAEGLVDAAEDGEMAPVVEYDPVLAAARFASQPMAVGVRQMRLIGPVLAFLSKIILDVQQGEEEAHRRERAEELTELISSLGPAVIKAGQALSSRSDLLPLEYLQSLEKLQACFAARLPVRSWRHQLSPQLTRALPSAAQDRVPPMPNEAAYAILRSELGVPLESLFRSIGPEPVAAASLGQVCRTEPLPRPSTALHGITRHYMASRGLPRPPAAFCGLPRPPTTTHCLPQPRMAPRGLPRPAHPELPRPSTPSPP